MKIIFQAVSFIFSISVIYFPETVNLKIKKLTRTSEKFYQPLSQIKTR